MNELDGRINASGMIVMDMIIPFASIDTAWIQTGYGVDSFYMTWDRLMVKSGGEQVVRTAKNPERHARIKDIVAQAAEVVDEVRKDHPDALQAGTIMAELANDQLDQKQKDKLVSHLIDFIIDNAIVRKSGHRVCPACMYESMSTSCFAELFSHGLIIPFRPEISGSRC